MFPSQIPGWQIVVRAVVVYLVRREAEPAPDRLLADGPAVQALRLSGSKPTTTFCKRYGRKRALERLPPARRTVRLPQRSRETGTTTRVDPRAECSAFTALRCPMYVEALLMRVAEQSVD